MTRRAHRAAAGWRFRVVCGLLAVLPAVLGSIAVGAPASASARPIGDCTTTSGVILAVDFSHWAGPILRACGTTPTTGFTLLNEGGWHTTGTGHDGPAFICRIGYDGYHSGTEYPTKKDESCVLTPPASAYWSYWHADPGQNTWSYSQLGAMGYHPKPGSVDLWNFGGTNIAGSTGSGIPSVSPNSLRANNTAPTGGGGGGGSSIKPRPSATHTTTAAPPGRSSTSATSPGHVGQTPAGSASTSATGDGAQAPSPVPDPTPSCTATPTATPPSPSLSPSVVSPEPSDSPSPSPPPSPSVSVSVSPTASASPCIADAPPRPAAHVSHGSAKPAIAALVLVVLLAAAGVTAVIRRPRREQ